MALVMDKTLTTEGDLTNFCLHYILEEGAVPEEEQVCAYCKTTWLQRLQTNVEQHMDSYTTNYPCLVEGGWVVHYGYARCPHCKGTKGDHLVQLIRRLVSSLVGSNVPEVTPKGQETLDFDPMLFVAGTAVAYPEQYPSQPLKTGATSAPTGTSRVRYWNFAPQYFLSIAMRSVLLSVVTAHCLI